MTYKYSVATGIQKIKTKLDLAKSSVVGLAVALPAVAVLAMGTGSALAGTYSLLGDATIVSGGNPGSAARLVSDTSLPNGYSGVDVSPAAPVAWPSLTTLSTDYNVTDDNCGGGSPRLSLGVDTNSDGTADGYVHVAIGPSPNFTDCLTGWQTTGNVIGNNDAGRYDYSQFGGSPFTTYSSAPASVLAGNVVSVNVIVDGSWSSAATNGDSEQTVLVDNTNVNGTITTYEPTVAPNKNSCKNNGWKTMSNPGPFKNQGDCVSYFATGGRNLPSGL
jgi:hypothetical protein